MSGEEWSRTPWWLQRTYIQGLKDEGIIETRAEVETEEWENDPLAASNEDFLRLGLSVGNLTLVQGGGENG